MRKLIPVVVPPAHCRLGCARPVGSQHSTDCIASGYVEPEQVVQLGGLPPLSLSGEHLEDAKLPLFVYRLLRDADSGAVERSAIEAEAAVRHSRMEISNTFLFEYAENIAARMTTGYPRSLDKQARGVIEGLLRVIDGVVSETDAKTDIKAAKEWLEKQGVTQ